MAALLAANKECEEIANNLYLVIRKEWVDLRDSTLKDWVNWVGREINGHNEVHYGNGSILMFRHGDDINALKNANLGGAVMVQAEEMNEQDFWFLNGRLRRKEGTRQLRLECNYDGRNWIYKLFNKDAVGKLITTNTYDNEKNLPPDYIPNLKKLPKRLQERHLEGSDADMEGQVWEEYSEGRHVIQPFEIPESWPRVISLDHGVTNPTAVLWGAIDFDGNVYIYDEHYEAGQVISHHAKEIKKRTEIKKPEDWLIDPACMAKISQKNGQLYSVWDEYNDYGLGAFRPANNSVLAGINRVNEYFKSDRLRIFKNCTHLIDEVGRYKWRSLKPGDEKNQPDEPIKKDDHACDSLRYLIMSRPDNAMVPSKKLVRFSQADFERMEKQQNQYEEVS
jgi:phage terminase large subunit